MRQADTHTLAWLIVGGIVCALVGGVWVPWWLAEHVSGAEPVPGGPIQVLEALASGEPAWPVAATVWAVILVAVLVGVLVVILTRIPGRHVDRAASRLPRDRNLRRYITGKGPRIGRVVTGRMFGGKQVVRATTEDQIVAVAGARTGKTTGLAIPAAIEHDQGPVLVTSNKRDIYDAISGPRAQKGTVWLFDPQQLASTEPAAWWWNPLTMCGDVRGARRLASIWSAASKDPEAREDAYFGPAGVELLASLLLAAARGGHHVSMVYEWLARPDDPTPVGILRDAPDCALMAEGLQGNVDLPGKQRAGVYGTAAKVVSWLADPQIRTWVEPSSEGLVEFIPESFVTSDDTLISLSKEEEGSATPLVTALTAAVLVTAERHAARSPGGQLGSKRAGLLSWLRWRRPERHAAPGGRLERPMLGVLDEAANVCRWQELPDQYSHYGSRGIILMSLFQSPAQMIDGFGRDGADKLWSTANVRIYAGGVTDADWLERLSKLTGQWDAPQWSHSYSSRTGSQRSRSPNRRPIFEVDALQAMPPGRALVLLSATRPVLVELQQWMNGPHAAAIEASIAASKQATPPQSEVPGVPVTDPAPTPPDGVTVIQ